MTFFRHFSVIFRVKNNDSYELFFLTNILSKWSIKEVKINYKNEKINPFQKEKRWVDTRTA